MDDKKTMRTVILAAEKTEYDKCREMFPEMECIRTGVGAGNVIRTCSLLPEGTRVINIGYAGSNHLAVGTVAAVSDTFRLTDGTYKFEDYANPLHLSDSGLPCHTANSFVTATDIAEPSLFDMELNYIAAFTPRLELLGSIKIVSDNLDVDVYINNSLRSSGILTDDKVWSRVRELAEDILTGNA